MVDPLDAGRRLFDAKRYDLAEAEFRRALALDPSLAVAHAYLALCLIDDRKRAGEARYEAEEARRLGPENPFTHYIHGAIALRLADPWKAEQSAREAIRLNPSNPYWYYLLADAFYERHRWAESLDAAEQGLRMDPTNVNCLNLRSMALIRIGRREEASETLGQALALDPEDPLSHANTGWSRLHREEFDAANAHFREALRVDPRNQLALLGLAHSRRIAPRFRPFLFRVFRGMADRHGRYFAWLVPPVGFRRTVGRGFTVAVLSGCVLMNTVVLIAANRFLYREAIAHPLSALSAILGQVVWFSFIVVMLTNTWLVHFVLHRSPSADFILRCEDRRSQSVPAVLVLIASVALTVGLTVNSLDHPATGGAALILLVYSWAMFYSIKKAFLKKVGRKRVITISRWAGLWLVLPAILALASAAAVVTPIVSTDLLDEPAGLLFVGSLLATWPPASLLIRRLDPTIPTDRHAVPTFSPSNRDPDPS